MKVSISYHIYNLRIEWSSFSPIISCQQIPSDKFQSTLFFIHAHNVPDPFNLLLISIYFKRNLLFWGSLIKVPQSIPKLENKDTSWGECTFSTKKLHKELKNVSKLFHVGIACKSCYFKVRNFRGLEISWSDRT